MRAALGLAAAEGLGSLSVRRVAAAAGIPATTLRHRFPAQADLRSAVAAELARCPLDDLSIADERREPSERLYECLAQLLPRDAAAVEGWFELCRMSNSDTGGAQRSGAGSVRRWLTILAGHGHLRPHEVDAQVSAAFAVVNGLYLRAAIRPDLDAARATLRWFAERVVSPPR